MALVAAPVYTVTYAFRDQSGSSAITQAYIQQGVAFADVLARASALATLLDAASDASLTGYTVSRSWIEDSPSAPASGSRVERKGRLIFNADAYRTRMDIPAIASGLVLPDGALDRGLTTIGAIETLMLVDFVGQFTDSRGVSLDSLAAAYEAFTRSTKRRLPTRRLEV